MRSRRTFLALLILRTVGASAQTVPLATLRVERGADVSCPDAEALRREVDRRLGRASFADDAPRRIDVEYRTSPRGRRRARITVRDGDATPSFRDLAQDGPGCDALAEAVTLAVALVIDPDAALRLPPPVAAACPEPTPAVCPACAECPPPPPPPPPPAAVVVQPPVPPVPPVTPTPRRALPAPWVALTGGVVLGVVAEAAGAVGFTVMAPLSTRWSLDLGVGYVPPVTTRDGAASVGRTAARAGVCLDGGASWVQFGGCADAMGGVLHLSALSLQPVAPGDRAWLAAAAEGHARLLPGSRWVISLSARAVVPLLTWAPRVEGAGAASYSPSPVAFEADLAVGARLW